MSTNNDNILYPHLPSTVFITIERLKELEALEANLPKMIEDAIQENKKKNLRRLHEKDKSNPESVNLRVKRYALRHKETLNARRRAKREEQKKALVEPTSPSQSPDLTLTPNTSSPTLFLQSNVITVRFDN